MYGCDFNNNGCRACGPEESVMLRTAENEDDELHNGDLCVIYGVLLVCNIWCNISVQ